jgi:spore germination cell wall hydrolase CwlJ-like protein
MDINEVDVSLECMAMAMYAEANTESARADIAHLILNRVRDGRFGQDVCHVVYRINKNGNYEFEGVKNVLEGYYPYPDKKTRLNVKLIAWRVYFKEHRDTTHGSLYFFDDRVVKNVQCKKLNKNLCFY